MPKRTSPDKVAPVRVVVVALDGNAAGAMARAEARLKPEIPGLSIRLHAASEWKNNPKALEQCRADIAEGDLILVAMLFMEEHINPVLEDLRARQAECDAMICCLAAGQVMKLTRMGGFSMSGEARGPLALLKRLKGSKKSGESSGKGQMDTIRRLPKILRFIPGTAQDVRAYFLMLQYFLGGSEDNFTNMVKFLVNRYAGGDRAHLKGSLKADPPIDYPENGVYHPEMADRMGEKLDALPTPNKKPLGTVGLLLGRSYVLAQNTGHYDGVIAALEAQNLKVVPAFSNGLDARETVHQFFVKDGKASVDAVISMTGFSLVGGPAYNDAKAAEKLLAAMDVPVFASLPVEFQSLQEWEQSDNGLTPLESTLMVAIPELDGSIGATVFGGRSEMQADGARCEMCAPDGGCTGRTGCQGRNMSCHDERAASLAARVRNMVALRHGETADKKVALVIFNFPPNGGSAGTAAYLSVFASLLNTLKAMKDQGYTVDVPKTVDDLRVKLLNGNAERFGTEANVHDLIKVDDHVAREPHLEEIETAWGPAPGKQLTDGKHLFVLGAQFGNVFIGLQPSFGYEGDPMRLLFEKDFAPTHAFAAFYSYLKQDFGADAVVHFGTHGALEFMPGKQVGLSEACWPDRLIGDLPNFYLYAANNPSEGTIAKRRSSATLLSYLTPPIANAGLYEALEDLKETIEHWRGVSDDHAEDRENLAEVIQAQAANLDLTPAEPKWNWTASDHIDALGKDLAELEQTLIPSGLHVLGQPPEAGERADLLEAIAQASEGEKPDRRTIDMIAGGAALHVAEKHAGAGKDSAMAKKLAELAKLNLDLGQDHELPALMHALEGGYIRPAPGGDVLRTQDILPTGRNIHGFDPYRIPSTYAATDGAAQAERIIARHMAEGHGFPQSIALVLWGTDNLKTGGGPISQALALMGARAKFDGYGRLCGAELIPLEMLSRPRVDVVVTLSGIFRDLLPLQTRVLAEAAFMAASADEPAEQNFIRKHALAYQRENGCDLETAALRVFGNDDGAYGANVNHMIEMGRWAEEDELADAFMTRKSFAFGREGLTDKQPDVLQSVLSDVNLAYQNLDSVELGVTTIDHYMDSLGGISRVAQRRGTPLPVYISDQTQSHTGAVRTLREQVALEARTRMLNPKWYEGMLKHGYEGVREIEASVTNCMGWSATTGDVDQWVYTRISETYVLDEEMRERLASLNPAAASKVAQRLLEAHERNYWEPDDEHLEALQDISEDLEDRLEGLGPSGAGA